jgi:diacylglycerol kinase family enzyme
VLIDGERRRFDLGMADGRYFLMMAGIGFDAEVVRAVPGGPKRRLGSTSYALWGAGVLARYRPRDVILRLDGEEVETRLYWLMVGNTRSYGGIIRIATQALVDDGRLDAYIFSSRGVRGLLSTAARLARGRLEGARDVTYRQVREVEVISAGLGVQIDGEYIGRTPMRFAVAPAAIDILLPPGAVAPLFAGRAAAANEQI